MGSQTSGRWSGSRKSEPQASNCKGRGDGFGPARLALTAEDEGHAVAKDSLGRQFEGTITSDHHVSLTLTGHSRCKVNGQMQDREWTASYNGEITIAPSETSMSLLGFESPCEECTFKVQYSLKKN